MNFDRFTQEEHRKIGKRERLEKMIEEWQETEEIFQEREKEFQEKDKPKEDGGDERWGEL